jgi:hypothetical protein
MISALSMPRLAAAEVSNPSGGKPLFASPRPAGRRITAGFSWLQRIGKSASFDVWFPEALRRTLNSLIEEGHEISPEHFPAEWAAVRQFELLQEAGNYKIYDLDATHLTRTLADLARNMRAGGYRVTVATIGSYGSDGADDDLEILDQRLQSRLSQLIHMLYLEEQSADINDGHHKALANGTWDYRTALPHVGVTLGARDLFHPEKPKRKRGGKGKKDGGAGGEPKRFSPEVRHKLARQFFDILSLLPHSHIVHDTAVGLQLPESINENEWIYLAQGEDTLRAFNGLLSDLFSPFDKLSLSGLDGRADAACEIKSTVQHMRGYGDRLTPEAQHFYQNLTQLSL